MNKIDTYIFSYNRPAQLYLLLESIINFDKNNNLNVFIQYSCDNEEFRRGYEILKLEFGLFEFIEETRFEYKKYNNPIFGNIFFNTFLWLKNWRFRTCNSNFKSIFIKNIDKSYNKYLMFLTDDSIFYKDIIIREEALKKLIDVQNTAYSLAAGKNIKGSSYKEESNIIIWDINIKTQNAFWNYSFSVDGRIYLKKDILKITKKVIFSNPNTFETVLVLYNRFFKIFNRIVANDESSLVGFELNRVQSQYKNNNFNLDYKMMNKYFLNGYKLNIEFDIDGVNEFRPKIDKIFMKKNGEKIIFKI